MRVAIAKRAVKRNEEEEVLCVLVDMGGVRELSESLHHMGLVAAAIFLLGPAGVERAEILESPIGPVHAQIEAVDDERHAVFCQATGGHVESALSRDRKTEIFVGGKLRIFVRLPQLHDVRRAPVAMREAVASMFHSGER